MQLLAPLFVSVALTGAPQFTTTQPPSTESAGPLKVYVLVGQSNMQGHAKPFTLDAMKDDAEVEALYERLVDRKGEPRTFDDVRVSCIGCADGELVGPLTVGFGASQREPKLGPELAFGSTVHEALDEPVLIIKTAWGGKSLHTDFRPPSASQGEAGEYYRLMLEHVRSVLADPGRVHPKFSKAKGVELAGFVWFQGWNDMVDGKTYPNRGEKGGYDAYTVSMAHFIRDVRRDLDAPDLPFVIGVLGVNGPVSEYGPKQKRYAGIHQNFRDAMAAPASMEEFEGTVTAVLTEHCWDQELSRLRELEREVGKDAMPEADRAKLKAGVSNAEYHYLGSAKILSRIGERFAEAVLELGERAR